MQPDTRLLDHPFYQAWNQGKVTEEQLANYAGAYQSVMDRIPQLWMRIVDGLSVDDPQAEEIIAEEQAHAELWTAWREALPAPTEQEGLADLHAALDDMSPAELAGALHAWEVQQPGVAETKKQGLLEHYNGADQDLTFFDEHIEEEDEHIAFGEHIREQHADTAAFDRGFQHGAQVMYHSLDAFVN